MRLVHAALQRLGAQLLFAADRRRPASQKAGDRGVGPQDPGAFVGDVARPPAVARPADGTEASVATVEAASSGRGAAGASQAADGTGARRDSVTLAGPVRRHAV